MKVAVIGANGQLGTDICNIYKDYDYDVLEFNHNRIDITDFDLCRLRLKDAKPDLVVNTAAMHHIESCEKEPIKAFEVNANGARNLAMLSNELDFTLVHFSTDYVFDGSKRTPYVESDHPLPLNVYGNSKLAGEFFVRTIAERCFVARISGIYGVAPCRAKGGLNFVKLMLKLAKEREEIRVVDDEILSPTYTLDIAEQIEKLTRTNHYGLFHMAARGSCSWYEFAAKIFEISNIKVKLFVAHPDEFPAKVPRPKYSVLENSALKALDLDIMPHWAEGLERYIKQI
jgi:dTDP-4-dehydrorhamnose reductase